MPSTPYILDGIVTDENSSAVASVVVIANNTTKDDYLHTTTDADGKYLIDLANAEYSTDDTVIVSVRDGRYFGETTTTITGTEGKTVDVSVNSITGDTARDKAWIALYNHLQSGTYAITTNNIHSAMSDDLVKTEGYPLVIIEPASTTNTKLTMNRDGIKERPITFNIMVYENTVILVEQLADEVEASIDNGWRNLAGSGLKNLEILEGDSDWFTEGTKKVHIRSIPLKFRYVKS